MALSADTQTHRRGIDSAFPWHDPEWFGDLERTEENCRAFLEDLRWPDGVCCPRCDSSETARLIARRRFWCRDCRYQFSVSSGTLFHNSHALLWKWFLAVRLLLESDDGLPANQLVHQLGGSYKTAWFIEHRVRAALKESQVGDRSPSRSLGETQPHAGREFCRVYDRALVGPYRQMGVKHLDSYLAESEWRSRKADNPHLFRNAILALLHGEPLPYTELIGRRGIDRGLAEPGSRGPDSRRSVRDEGVAMAFVRAATPGVRSRSPRR